VDDAVSNPSQAPRTGGLRNLRIYTTNEGKLPDLLKRFREHTWQDF